MTREKAIVKVNALLKMTTNNGTTEGEERNARELAIAMIQKYRIEFDELKDPPFTRAELEVMAAAKCIGEVVSVFTIAFEQVYEAVEIIARELARLGKTIEDVLIEWNDEELFVDGKRVYRVREKGNDYGKRYGQPSRALHLRKCGVHRSDTFRSRR